MGIPWRNIGHLAAAVAGVMVPQVLVAEQAVEELVKAKGLAKRDAAVTAAVDILKGYEGITGKNLHDNPAVTEALTAVNDALVKLRDTLGTAAAAPAAAPGS